MENLLFEHVLKGGYSIYVVLLVFLLLYKSSAIMTLAMSLRTSFRKRYSVINHELLHSQTYYMNVIDDINFKDDDHKTYILKTIMNIKIDTVINTTVEFIKSFDYSISEAEMKTKMYTHVRNIVSTYESKIMEALVSKYKDKKGKLLYNIVYKKFKAYHEANIDFINVFINSIKILKNKHDKVAILYVFVTLLKVAIDLSIDDIKSVFNGFNGQIQLLIYDKKLGDVPEE